MKRAVSSNQDSHEDSEILVEENVKAPSEADSGQNFNNTILGMFLNLIYRSGRGGQ